MHARIQVLSPAVFQNTNLERWLDWPDWPCAWRTLSNTERERTEFLQLSEPRKLGRCFAACSLAV